MHRHLHRPRDLARLEYPRDVAVAVAIALEVPVRGAVAMGTPPGAIRLVDAAELDPVVDIVGSAGVHPVRAVSSRRAEPGSNGFEALLEEGPDGW